MDHFNYNIFENPIILKQYGFGILFKNEFSFDIEFRYYLINEKGILFCISKEPLPVIHRFNLLDSKWKIIGKNQQGKVFQSNDLIITKFTNEHYFEFEQDNDIIIGDLLISNETDSAKYWVLNLFINDLTFTYSNFIVEIRRESTYEQELVAKYWQIPQFGSSITLIRKNGSNELYEKLINSIIILLTLALGKSLSIPLREFDKNGNRITLISSARPTHRKIQSIVPENSIRQFLETTLLYFETDFENKYFEMRTLLEYINSTDIGYLDDRVLSMIQVYEIVAKKWGNKYELPAELKDLKTNIKEGVTQWHKRHSTFDKSFICQRLTDALAWQKTTKTLESLLENLNFNQDVLKVDFESLVGWRHKVAHEGMLHSVDNNEVADKLLDAQFAIRLLILKKIGYTGKVLTNKGFDSQKNVNDYFI